MSRGLVSHLNCDVQWWRNSVTVQPSLCHGTSHLRRLINPHKLCSAAWHGQQSFLPFPLRDPHDDPPLQTGRCLVVRQRDLVSPRQRHIADVFLWGIAFQYPYWYASAFQPLHQAVSVWWLVAHNDDIAPLQAVLSWKHAMVMTSEHIMVTSPSPEMGVSEHRPMTSWCPQNMTCEHGMVTSPNPETDVSEHRPITWCPQNMPGSWPVSTEWWHHPTQRLMSVNTDQSHDVLKTCQDHDQWARNGDVTQSWDGGQWTQTNDRSSKHARIMTSEHGMVMSPSPEMGVSEHRPMTGLQNMPGSWPVSTEWWHHPVQRLMSVNTGQWHDVLKTCQDHDQWARNGDITQSRDWYQWTQTNDMMSSKHARIMTSEHGMVTSPNPETDVSEHRPMTWCPQNMPGSWPVSTEWWCHIEVSEHTPMTWCPQNMPGSWPVSAKWWLHPDQWTQTSDITLSWKHAFSMISEHRPMTYATILKTCLDHDQWTQTNDITLSWKHAFSMISEHRPTASHYPENMPSAWSVNTDQRHHTDYLENMPWAWLVNTDQWHHTILKKCLEHDLWTLTSDICHPA